MSAAIPGVKFARAIDQLLNEDPAGSGGAPVDVVVFDLVRYSGNVEAARVLAPNARFVGFAPHISEIARDETASGVDLAMPRSRFFHDIRAALGYS